MNQVRGGETRRPGHLWPLLCVAFVVGAGLWLVASVPSEGRHESFPEGSPRLAPAQDAPAAELASRTAPASPLA